MLVCKDIRNYLAIERIRLDKYEINQNAMDPSRILDRGFSITIFKGKPIKDTDGLKPEDEIESILSNGRLISSIKKIQKQ
jgi:exodeoxyribonuclease VII large subunit